MSEATLYRCRTRSDWLCPCGRVARELRSRGVAVEQVRVSPRGREAIDELTGQRRVPVLVLGREVICDSRRIVEHLQWRDEQPPG